MLAAHRGKERKTQADLGAVGSIGRVWGQELRETATKSGGRTQKPASGGSGRDRPARGTLSQEQGIAATAPSAWPPHRRGRPMGPASHRPCLPIGPTAPSADPSHAASGTVSIERLEGAYHLGWDCGRRRPIFQRE